MAENEKSTLNRRVLMQGGALSMAGALATNAPHQTASAQESDTQMTAGSDGFQVERGLRVSMRDGVELIGDLWRPNNRARSSTILYRTPYNRDLLHSDFFRPIEAVRAGFSVLIQDTRGRFESEGEWRPIMWNQEGEDGYDTVQWIAEQPWSTGSVGMSGPSYLGIAQLVTARLKPPALKAIAPAIATVDEFERIEIGGGMRLDHLISWLAFMALDWAQRRIAAGQPLDAADMGLIIAAAQNPRQLMDHRPIQDIPLFQIPDFPVSFEALMAGEGSAQVDVAEIEIPTLHAGGWFDVFARSSVGMFQKQKAAGNADAQLLMGCWTHATSLDQQHGEVNFGAMASGASGRIGDQHVAFFRKHLDGHDAPLPTVRYFTCMGDNWAEAAIWPPEGARTERVSLRADSEGPASYRYDPKDPTPTVGGRVLFIGGLAMGPIDQRKLDGRSDILRFESAPLSAPLDLVGPTQAKLRVSSSAPSTDFICKLIDIGGDGTRLPITDGVIRIQPAERELIDSTSFVDVEIALADIAWRVAEGHCLGLQIQSANYPHLDPNFNDGEPIGVSESGSPADNKVDVQDGASSLTLSIIGEVPPEVSSLTFVAT